MRFISIGLITLTLFATTFATMFVPSAHAFEVQCVELFEPELNLENYVQQSVIEIDGRSVYLEQFDAKPGFGTAVVFMGLFTPISDLHSFQREFIRRSKGEGLLIFTYSTQTESLIWRRYGQKLKLADPTVDLMGLVREATAAVNAAGIVGPVTAVGYSFGSAPAVRFAEFHKGRVTKLVLAGPLVEPGDQSAETLASKHSFEAMSSFNPFFGSSMLENGRETAAESSATSIIDDYLKKHKFPRRIKREQAIAALKAQIRSAETFDLAQEVSVNWPATTFLVGEKEASTRFRLQKSVIAKLEAAGVPTDLTVVESGPHAILAAKPRESVDVVLSVMRGGKN